jgi:TonB family protein
MRDVSVWTVLGVTWGVGAAVLLTTKLALYALAPSPVPPLPELFVRAAPMATCAPYEPPPAPVHAPPVRPPGAPRKTRDVAPVYPKEALAARLQGVVILEVVIDCSGRVVDARVVRSVPGLNDAALDAVRQWGYAPALKDGIPTFAVMTVPVSFSLQN